MKRKSILIAVIFLLSVVGHAWPQAHYKPHTEQFQSTGNQSDQKKSIADSAYWVFVSFLYAWVAADIAKRFRYVSIHWFKYESRKSKKWYVPVWSHLTLAGFVVGTSWLGWTNALQHDVHTDWKKVIDWPSLLLVVDFSIVGMYFPFVAKVNKARLPDAKLTTTLDDTAAYWIVWIMGAYLLWDACTYWWLWGSFHYFALRSWMSAYGLILALLALPLLNSIRKEHPLWLMGGDASLLCLLLYYRAVKEIPYETFPWVCLFGFSFLSFPWLCFVGFLLLLALASFFGARPLAIVTNVNSPTLNKIRGTMPKKIVFCADGTWNHPQDPGAVTDGDTNVFKLYKCLSYSSTQFTAYDPGVGTGGNALQHVTGGAFGDGLLQKIKDGYTAIAHVYEQDDSIYIFGFSRGAYTARSLAGMIATCGLPTKGFDQNLVDTAFTAYRSRDAAQRQSLLKSLADYDLYDAKITCLGVWDTVGALGIPVDPLGLDNAKYGFLDTSLHPDVRNAFHAVSIDERRAEFPPTLWTPPFADGQRVEQVWFAGVHCDVGGGYSETGLSDITLGWMLTKALSCEKPALEALDSSANPYLNVEAKHALDTIHESWKVLWGFPRRRTVPQNATVSNSVGIRVTNDANYRPPNVQLAGNPPTPNYATQNVIAAPALAVAAGQ